MHKQTNYPCLSRRQNGFHIRMAIPKRLWMLAKCKEICYPLHTACFEIAIMRWKKELAHLQKFLDVFEETCMLINKNNKVILNRTDVDKVLLYRLEQIQFFTEENAGDIMDGVATYDNIRLYDSVDKKKNPDKVKALMSELIFDYIKDLIAKQEANTTLRTVFGKLQAKEAELGYAEKDSEGYEWFKSFSNQLGILERYALKSIESIKEDKPYTTSNPKVQSLLRSYDEKRTRERLDDSMTHTHWEKLFRKFLKNKENIKGIKQERGEVNRRSLMIAFSLMGKNYLEDIKEQDCRKMCENIYRLPKKWNGVLEEGQVLSDILTDGKSKALSKSTIKRHLITFKEFMRFAVKEQIIPNSFNDVVELPLRLEPVSRTPFTDRELKKIFNPVTYVSPMERKNQPKFWVPLLALYHGCRINEICQLDTNDIIARNGLECISINENGKDKSLKNKCSERIIPIHPVLKDLGFLEFVGYQQRNHAEKLFDTLVCAKHNRYGKAVEQWFARYLDALGIKGKDKVFHSFRHTFENKAIEMKLHTEHQNALGGWSNGGVGQRVYGGHLSIPNLYEEISKINYPIRRELQGLKEAYAKCYVIRFFEDMRK